MVERAGAYTSVVHSFREQLEFSADLSNEAAWVSFYRRLWPTAIACVRLDAKGQGQRDGLDRAIHFESGKVFYIDEKNRRKDYSDLLLEDWSVWYSEKHPRNKIGWALDEQKRCDFVAYAIHPKQVCYLLPFELLRLAFKTKHDEWERLERPHGRVPDAMNDGYRTRNIAVPWTLVRAAIIEQMHRRFSARELNLPTPTQLEGQLQFAWQVSE